MNQIARIHRQIDVAARQDDSISVAFESNPVAQVDRVHESFQLMKSVWSLAENIQQQINFAW